MSRKLKVYGISTFLTGRQNRTIAAVTSQKEFAKLINTSLSYVREYGCETGNEDEIKLAFSHAGAVFIECRECKYWHKWAIPARRGPRKGIVCLN